MIGAGSTQPSYVSRAGSGHNRSTPLPVTRSIGPTRNSRRSRSRRRIRPCPITQRARIVTHLPPHRPRSANKGMYDADCRRQIRAVHRFATRWRCHRYRHGADEPPPTLTTVVVMSRRRAVGLIDRARVCGDCSVAAATGTSTAIVGAAGDSSASAAQADKPSSQIS